MRLKSAELAVDQMETAALWRQVFILLERIEPGYGLNGYEIRAARRLLRRCLVELRQRGTQLRLC